MITLAQQRKKYSVSDEVPNNNQAFQAQIIMPNDA